MKSLFASAVILAAVAILMAPAVAVGSTWTVKDRVGHSRGTVRNTHGLFQGDVKRPSGSWAGWISSSDSGGGGVYSLNKGKPRTVIGDSLAWAKGNKLHPGNGTMTKVLGKVVKTNGRWLVFKRSSGAFHRVGSVPGACSRGYAMGAGRLLLWRRQAAVPGRGVLTGSIRSH